MYGYVYLGERKETYAPDPDAAPVVTDIYAKADAGWSARRIARYLNEQGTPTASMLLYRRGELPESRRVAQEWSTQMVLDILKNESYTGKHAARKYTTTKEKRQLEDGRIVTVRHRHTRPETDEKRKAITIPALVTVEQWARVQEEVKSRHNERLDETDVPLLSRGVAYCGVCSARMLTIRRKDWKERRYMCSYHSAGCTGKGFALKSSEVDGDVWAKVKEIVRDDERYTRLVEGKSAKLAARHAEAVERVGLVARELADMREKQATVFRRMNDEQDDGIAAMYRQELQRLNETVAGLEKRASEAQDAVDAVQGKRTAHSELLAWIDSLIAEWRAKDTDGRYTRAGRFLLDGRDDADGVSLDALDREQRRGILRLLGVRVVMYPVNAEYSRTHDTRWEFTFSATATGTVHQRQGTS
jgi:hypothetical protein